MSAFTVDAAVEMLRVYEEKYAAQPSEWRLPPSAVEELRASPHGSAIPAPPTFLFGVPVIVDETATEVTLA